MNTSYNITDFGAISDGITNNASAIQNAIDQCTENGGGKVIIPPGKFLSGTIILKSNVNLHLEAGAELILSLNPDDMIDFMKYFDDDNQDTGWEGGCFIMARHAENITISGEGRIDGRGRKVFYEDEELDGGSHESPLKVRGFRPRMSFLENIKNLTVKDVTFYDAAFWTLHMAGCSDVLIENIRIENNDRGPNNDGIDPDCCRNVIIRGCKIVCADDCIVVKTTAPMTRKYGSCSNILISNCILNSHSSALKIGTETWGDIHHIVMSDCILENCSRGIGIWSRDGGNIYDIIVHHISGNTRRYRDRAKQDSEVVRWWGKGEPIFINATKRAGVDRIPGKIESIYFDHMRMNCEGTIMVAGEEYSVIKNVIVSDSTFVWKKQGEIYPDCLDEQPSERGVYKHETPCVFIRSGENISLEDKVVLIVDESLKEYIRECTINI